MKKTLMFMELVLHRWMTRCGYSVAMITEDRYTSKCVENKDLIIFKMSKVEGCKLTRIGDLPFDYHYGGCNTFSFGIMLCRSDYVKQDCQSLVQIQSKFSSTVFYLVLMELHSKRNHHQICLIITSRRLDLIENHHSLPDNFLEMMDYTPKF